MTSGQIIVGIAGLLAPIVLAYLIVVIGRRRRDRTASRPIPETRPLDLGPWLRLFSVEDDLLLADRPDLRRRLRRNRIRVAQLYLRDLEDRSREIRRAAASMPPPYSEVLGLRMLKLGFLSRVLRIQLLLGGGPLPALTCRSIAAAARVLERGHQIKTSPNSPRVLDSGS